MRGLALATAFAAAANACRARASFAACVAAYLAAAPVAWGASALKAPDAAPVGASGGGGLGAAETASSESESETFCFPLGSAAAALPAGGGGGDGGARSPVAAAGSSSFTSAEGPTAEGASVGTPDGAVGCSTFGSGAVSSSWRGVPTAGDPGAGRFGVEAPPPSSGGVLGGPVGSSATAGKDAPTASRGVGAAAAARRSASASVAAATDFCRAFNTQVVR